MQLHGAKGAEILGKHGIDPALAGIVQRHNHTLYSGTYTRPVEIALQAADSASGLVTACALVKGGRLSDVTIKTVTKKVLCRKPSPREIVEISECYRLSFC